MATKLVEIGTVSHATMRAEDLIPCFADLLSELNEARSLSWREHFADELEATKEFSRLDSILAEIEQRQQQDDYYDSEDACYDLNETLFDELNAFAPPYCYFGSHEGDGSDYGFWPSWDSIEDACHDGTMIKVSDLSELPDNYTGEALHVSDHGNATLYSVQNGNATEVWAIV